MQTLGWRQGSMVRIFVGSTFGPTDAPPSPLQMNPFFNLVYGVEAMIPVEIGEPSLRRQVYDSEQNQQNMCTHLDLLPEVRDKAQICNMEIKQSAAQRYNANLCP